MFFKTPTLVLYAVLLAAVTTAVPDCTAAEEKPWNVVFFLVDDLGWADVGCFGSTFHQTPNIDALGAGGMRFNFGYAACPVCSPCHVQLFYLLRALSHSGLVNSVQIPAPLRRTQLR